MHIRTIQLLGFLLAGPALCMATTASQTIDNAIHDLSRPSNQVAQDESRKPAQLLVFSGVKPGDKVVDFMSGNAYFTRLLSAIVGSSGHVYAFLPTEQLNSCGPEEIAGTRLVEHDVHYPNVSVLSGPVNQFIAPEKLDLVWTSLNFHDLYDTFMGPADVQR